MKAYILIVEDEEEIATVIRYNLEKNDFEATVASNGEEALLFVAERKPDLIVLDWMLPLRTGMEVCQQLRKNEVTLDIPIIMLTARGEESDRLMGLDSGVDDYMVKPFSPMELIARIRAVLRRTRPMVTGKELKLSGIIVDMTGHKITYKDKKIHLGPTEFRLLAHLMEQPGRVFSREQLLDSVWGMDVYVESRTVDVHIRRLRKALDKMEKNLSSVIKTVRSAGYMIEKPE